MHATDAVAGEGEADGVAEAAEGEAVGLSICQRVCLGYGGGREKGTHRL